MSTNIYTILIDLNDTKLYPVLRMLSFIDNSNHFLRTKKEEQNVLKLFLLAFQEIPTILYIKTV
jgi:hypothetical protein